MTRPTWDEMKASRDGSTAPLLTAPGEPPGQAAWKLAQRNELKRLLYRAENAEWDVDSAMEELGEAEERLDTAQGDVAALCEEMGIDPDDAWDAVQ